MQHRFTKVFLSCQPGTVRNLAQTDGKLEMNQARALWAMLFVAASFLGFTGFLSLMASMGLVPWGEASQAVEAFSVLSSLVVGGVVGLYLGSGPS